MAYLNTCPSIYLVEVIKTTIILVCFPLNVSIWLESSALICYFYSSNLTEYTPADLHFSKAKCYFNKSRNSSYLKKTKVSLSYWKQSAIASFLSHIYSVHISTGSFKITFQYYPHTKKKLNIYSNDSSMHVWFSMWCHRLCTSASLDFSLVF